MSRGARNRIRAGSTPARNIIVLEKYVNIHINFDRVDSHRAYIEEQKVMIGGIMSDLNVMKVMLNDAESIELYNEIMRELQLVRDSIIFRQELMETTALDFRNILKQERDIIAQMDMLLNRHGIGE